MFADTVIDLTRCVIERVLITFYVFLNIYSSIHNVFKIIQKKLMRALANYSDLAEAWELKTKYA